MKVLHIIDSGGLYGAEIVLLNLVDEQIKLGLKPTIASIGEKHIEEKPLETEALKRSFKVKKFRMFPGPNTAGAFKILRYAQRNSFDLFHSHGYKGNVAFGLMPKNFRKIPMVSTAHGWTSTTGISKNRIYEILDAWSLRFIDAVVLVSNAMKTHPRLKKLNGNNIHVIPNGIPIPDNAVRQFNDLTIQRFNDSTNQPFDNSTNQQLDQSPTQFDNLTNQPINQFPTQFNDLTTQQFVDSKIIKFCEGGFTIGTIGRLSTEKGYKYLIQALFLLVKNGIDARLVIIGEGYERGLLEELIAQLGLKDRILLPGYRDNAKLYIPFFNVFVISSLTEGLPITLLEAMQSRVPIVATRVGGIPEVLQNGDAGILIEPCNPEALAEKIIKIHNNRKFAEKLIEAAYQRVITNYSSKAMAQKYLDLYKDLANQVNRPK